MITRNAARQKKTIRSAHTSHSNDETGSQINENEEKHNLSPSSQSSNLPPSNSHTVHFSPEKNQPKILSMESLVQENKALAEENKRLKNEILLLRKMTSNLNKPNKSFSPDDDLSDFKEIEVVGKGTETQVFHYEKTKTVTYTISISVKVIKNSAFRLMTNFKRDIEALSQKHHPCLCKVFAVKEEPSPSIILPFYPYSLKTIVKKISPTEKAMIIAEIAYALRFIHEKLCVVHRNLRPENILISNKKHAKVTDYYFAAIEPSDFLMMKGQDARHFIAPELFDGNEATPKVDIYSFGKIVYFIATDGEMPYFRIADVLSGKLLEIPESFAKPLKDLIISCITIEPDKRPSIDEIIDLLRKHRYCIFKGVDPVAIEAHISTIDSKEKYLD